MSFVPAVLQREPKWELVDPLRDGRRCPDCKATIHGRQARREHREWHIERREFDSMLLEAVRKIALKAGLNVAGGPDPELYDGAGQLDYDDQDEENEDEE